MAVDVTKVSLGPCSVTFGGTDLGHTIGGVEAVYAVEYHETKVDKFGNTIVERFLLGENLSATVPLGQYQLAVLAKAIPMGTLAAATKLTVGKTAGAKQSTYAATLVLHPIEMGSDRSLDWVIYKAMATTNVTMTFGPDGERIASVEFHGLLDENKSDGAMLGLIGDSAA